MIPFYTSDEGSPIIENVFPQPDRFSGISTCLAIREDGAIVAFDDRFDEGKGGLLVDELLGRFGCEDAIEGKGLTFRVIYPRFVTEATFLFDGERLILLVDVDDGFALHRLLALVHGTDAHHDLDSFTRHRYFMIIIIGV